MKREYVRNDVRMIAIAMAMAMSIDGDSPDDEPPKGDTSAEVTKNCLAV